MFASDPELLAAIGPRVRKSPFYGATVSAGLTAVSSYNHMWLPMSYGDPDAEYRRLTTGVSMWDVAAQRHVEVTGSDADLFVQQTTTVNIADLPRGRAVYAPVVDHEGLLINDPVLFHWTDGSWRFSISDSDLRLWLSPLALALELSVHIRELDTASLAIQGPRSHDVLTNMGLDWVLEADDLEFRPGRVSTGTDDLDVVVSRSGWSNQGGAELFLDDPQWAQQLWRAVESAGAEVGIGPGAPNATERIENVLLSYGTDTGYDANPLELGLEGHLDLDQSDFVGRAALVRIRDEGPARRLLGVVIEGEAIDTLPSPIPLYVDGEKVGALRAAVHSPRFERNIGLALVQSDCEPGTHAQASRHGDDRSLRFVALPFEDRLDE